MIAAQSSASSARVAGSPLLSCTTYPELRLGQTSGTHPRRILENPRACLLQAGITDGRCRHDADLGLGISRYRRGPRAILSREHKRERASERGSEQARIPRVTQILFLRRFIDGCIGASFWKKYTSPAILRNRRSRNKIPPGRGKVRLGERDRILRDWWWVHDCHCSRPCGSVFRYLTCCKRARDRWRDI